MSGYLLWATLDIIYYMLTILVGYREFGRKNINRSILVRFQIWSHLFLQQRIRNTHICPKIVSFTTLGRGEPPVRDLLTKYIQLHLTSSGRLPPPNLVNPKIFFGHFCVFLVFCRTIWWLQIWNRTKIERFIYFFQTVKNKEYGPRKWRKKSKKSKKITNTLVFHFFEPKLDFS